MASHSTDSFPALILGGICLSGKSTLAKTLRRKVICDTEFFEGDDFHTIDSIDKMRSGQPLAENDRAVWRDRIGGLIAERPTGKLRIITCSALTRNLRDALRGFGEVRIVFLTMSRDRAEQRAAYRLKQDPKHYYQPARYPALLDGQYRDEEQPGEDEPDCLLVDLETLATAESPSYSAGALATRVADWLQLNVK